MTRRHFAAGACAAPWAAAAAQQQNLKREFFFRPVNAWAADFIPFYWEGQFYLYYLLDWRDKAKYGEGTPWYLITTRDFVEFTEHGEVLPRGARNEQDRWVYTGSVLQAEGKFHIYYTGHNTHLKEEGKPQEAVMHAISDDLLKWRKLPDEKLFAPQPRYEPHDWRDPFVFWNDDAREYWMLLAARLNEGPSRRRGCTVLCASTNLKTWEVREPFWTPGTYFTHECPDLFRMGNWWYLIFSEFSDGFITRYRMSRGRNGPWLTPENDTFDGRAFYAAKTASDGQRRFLFGWNPTREEAKDYRKWHWGGNLVVHELVQESGGSLAVKAPLSVDRRFSAPHPVNFQTVSGRADARVTAATLTAPGSFACASGGTLPERANVEVSMRLEPGTRRAGVVLRASKDFESGYFVRFEPKRERLVFDSWPRPRDSAHMAELERPFKLEAGRQLDIKIFVDGSVCVAYAGQTIAMNARMYDLHGANWGVFVEDGKATFSNARVLTT